MSLSSSADKRSYVETASGMNHRHTFNHLIVLIIIIGGCNLQRMDAIKSYRRRNINKLELIRDTFSLLTEVSDP